MVGSLNPNNKFLQLSSGVVVTTLIFSKFHGIELTIAKIFIRQSSAKTLFNCSTTTIFKKK